MNVPLGLTRFNIEKPDSGGVMHVVPNAIVTVYDTNLDGTSPITVDGVVSIGAIKSTLYADRNNIATLANPVVADSLGLVQFYTVGSIIHLQVTTPTGLTYGIPWYSGTVLPKITVATDYPNLQAAIDATPPDGTLFVPAGSYSPADANGWLINKSITIEGVGYKSPDANSTWFRPFGDTAVGGAPNSRVFKVAAGTARVNFKNFIIFPQVAPTTDGTGDGIWFDCIGASCFFCTMSNVDIWFMGRDGIRAIGDGAPGFFDENEFTSVRVNSCRGDGFNLVFTTDLAMFGCSVFNCRSRGIFANFSTGILFDACRFNGNAINSTGGADPQFSQGQVYLTTTHRWTFVSCDFEHFEGNACKNAIAIDNCRGGAIISVGNFNNSLVVGTVGIYAIGSNHGIQVVGGSFTNVQYAVKVLPARGNVGWHVSPGACTNNSGSANTPATYDIPQEPSNGATPTGGSIEFPTMHDNLAAADILGEFIAGIQLPRVHGVAAITNPKLKDGWLVFDELDGKLKIRTGGAWVVVGTQV